MKHNLNKLGGLHKSQNLLLALTQKGLTREKAYSIVQSSAMEAWKSKQNFKNITLKNKELLKYLNKKEINQLFINNDQLNKIDWIFKNKF